jgi:hypothetical protein
MPSPRQPDAIQNLLDEAETELSRRLREACEAEARGVSTESASEVRRLEDTLYAAAKAAGRAHAARRHIAAAEAQGDAAESTVARHRSMPAAALRAAKLGGEEATPAAPPEIETVAHREPPVSTAVREFEDSTGRSWRAWPVIPGLARARETSRKILGDYEEGWICFEALDNSGRRRLPRHEPRWSDLPHGELQQLLDQAIDAPERRGRRAPPRGRKPPD